MRCKIALERGLVAVADGQVGVGVHDYAGALDVEHVVHVDDIGPVNLNELRAQFFAYGRKRTEREHRGDRRGRGVDLQILAVALDVADVGEVDADVAVVDLDEYGAGFARTGLARVGLPGRGLGGERR